MTNVINISNPEYLRRKSDRVAEIKDFFSKIKGLDIVFYVSDDLRKNERFHGVGDVIKFSIELRGITKDQMLTVLSYIRRNEEYANSAYLNYSNRLVLDNIDPYAFSWKNKEGYIADYQKDLAKLSGLLEDQRFREIWYKQYFAIKGPF